MDFSFYEYLLAFVGAFVAGFIDAMIGGGGLISLPVLLGLGLPPALAVATNKLQATMGILSSLLALWRRIRWREMALGVAVCAVMAWLGSYTLTITPSASLRPLVAVILVVVFVYSICRPSLGEMTSKPRMKMWVFLLCFGALIGFYDGFIGPGTGSFWIFAFVSLMGINMRDASVNTKLLNAASNVASLMFFVINYEIEYCLGLCMGCASIIGASLGARMLLRANLRLIKALFCIIVLCTIGKVCFDYFIAI